MARLPKGYGVGRVEKTCPKCKETKSVEKFHKHAGSTDGKQGYCKSCANSADRFYKYGITKDKYLEMLKKQHGVCAICLGTNLERQRLFIDHDHKTGKVRGLLCKQCNSVLGLSGDNPHVLRLGALYLEDKCEG